MSSDTHGSLCSNIGLPTAFCLLTPGLAAAAEVVATAHVLALERRKDHAPGDGLQHACDHYVDLLVDGPCAILDHDHGAVVEVAHALARLLAHLNDLDPHLFAGQDHGFDGVRQFVHVQHAHALQLRYLIEVIVVGNNGRVQLACDLHQLAVDLVHVAHVAGIDVHDVDRRFGFLAHPVEHIQAPTPTVAAQHIGRVGNVAQLVEHEARDHHFAHDEAGGADVGDAAIDDGARVDQDLRAIAVLGVLVNAGGVGTGREPGTQVVPPHQGHPHADEDHHDGDHRGEEITDRRAEQDQRH